MSTDSDEIPSLSHSHQTETYSETPTPESTVLSDADTTYESETIESDRNPYKPKKLPMVTPNHDRFHTTDPKEKRVTFLIHNQLYTPNHTQYTNGFHCSKK